MKWYVIGKQRSLKGMEKDIKIYCEPKKTQIPKLEKMTCYSTKPLVISMIRIYPTIDFYNIDTKEKFFTYNQLHNPLSSI